MRARRCNHRRELVTHRHRAKRSKFRTERAAAHVLDCPLIFEHLAARPPADQVAPRLLPADLIVGDQFGMVRGPNDTGLNHRLKLLRRPVFYDGLLDRCQHVILGCGRDGPLGSRCLSQCSIVLDREADEFCRARIGRGLGLWRCILERGLEGRAEVRGCLVGAGVRPFLGCDLEVWLRGCVDAVVVPTQQRQNLSRAPGIVIILRDCSTCRL